MIIYTKNLFFWQQQRFLNTDTLISENIWHGEELIASYTTDGGNRPWHSDSRKPEKMFDSDKNSIWHAYLPVSIKNRIIITFTNEIVFTGIELYPRQHQNQEMSYYNCIKILYN